MSNISIVCVLKSGGDFDGSYVVNLKRMLDTNISGSYSFFCFTDMPVQVNGAIIPLRRSELQGWWAKLEAFRMKGPTIYLDLDTALFGSLDKLIEAVMASRHDEFYMLRAFRKTERFASGVMAWNGDWQWLWKPFREQDKLYQWDQRYIRESILNAGYGITEIQSHVRVYSYRHHCMENGVPKDADIVCFHGKPRPRNVGGIYFQEVETDV